MMEKEEEKRPPKTTTMHPMFTTKEKKKEETNAYNNNNVENINDAKRVAEATIDLTKGGEQTDAKTTTNLNKDIQKFCCTKQEEEESIVDLTQEKDNDDEKKKTRTEEQPPQKVHSFFQKRKPQAKSIATATDVPGASRKTPYEEAVKHLPPIHVNCPIRTVVGADAEDVMKGYGIAFENAVASAAERRRSLLKSSSASTGASFQWRYEIKSDDEKKDEEMSIETEEEEEEEEETEPIDEYSRAIINRLESQSRGE